MADRNLQDFHGRAERIAQRHDRTGGRRSLPSEPHFRREAATRVVRSLLALVLALSLLKALILWQVGAPTYQARVGRLARGGPLDRVGAMMMRPDPLTRALAGQIVPAARLISDTVARARKRLAS